MRLFQDVRQDSGVSTVNPDGLFGRYRVLRQFFFDDSGQDLVEYGILTGIVVAIGVAVFTSINDKMADAYGDWGTEIQTNWVPAPALPPAP